MGPTSELGGPENWEMGIFLGQGLREDKLGLWAGPVGECFAETEKAARLPH